MCVMNKQPTVNSVAITNFLQFKFFLFMCLAISEIIKFSIGKESFSQVIDTLLDSVEDPCRNRFETAVVV